MTRRIPTAAVNAAAAVTLNTPPASATAMIQERVLTGKTRSRGRRGLYALWTALQPDQAGHSSGHAIAPVGKEAVGFTDGARLPAADCRDTELPEALPGQQIDVTRYLPSSPCAVNA